MSDAWKTTKAPRAKQPRLSRRAILAIAGVLGVGLLLVAMSVFGGGDATSPYPTWQDACQLLDEDLVEDVTGRNVDREGHDSATAPTLCHAYFERDEGGEVTLYVLRGEGKKMYDAAYKGTPVKLGDEAKWNSQNFALVVRQADDVIEVRVFLPGSDAKKRAQAIRIARDVLPELRKHPVSS